LDIRNKMNPFWADMKGGLLSTVTKADVGAYSLNLAKSGCTMLSSADPFKPDGKTPEFIALRLREALGEDLAAHYPGTMAGKLLTQEITKKLERYNKLTIDRTRNLRVVPGSDAGLFYAMSPWIVVGDEVMIPDPSYPNNFWNTKLLGGIAVPIPLREEDGYRIDTKEFEKRLSPKTKLVLLTHPNNPTTTVYSRKELEDLSQFIIKNNLVLICDQAFEDIIFDDKEFVSPASLPGMFKRTVSVFSVSKGLGLSGYRIAYLVADENIMDVYIGSAVYTVSASNTAAQLALVEAYRNPAFIQEYKKIFDRRRRVVYEKINAVAGVHMAMPQASFLSWVNVSKLGSSAEICSELARIAKVASNDGITYGKNGDGHLRIVHGCYSDDQVVFDAIDRLCGYLTERARGLGIN
jgi:aspartate/methionine/tyrosine aminotransferase